MADFINRESEGRTLRASRPSWVSSTSLPMATVRAQETTRDALDGRVDLLVVQLAVDEDLALGDVARQVGDRVRDVCERALTAGSASASARARHGRGERASDGPSLGMVRIGIWVIEPLRPSTRPARS